MSLCNGSVNGDVFYAWLGLDFWPEVKQKPLIVMAKARFHKCVNMIEVIENHGCVVQSRSPL